jgi:hypothetical protein
MAAFRVNCGCESGSAWVHRQGALSPIRDAVLRPSRAEISAHSKDEAMKRLVSVALALTLLGATAASANSYGRGGYDRGYSHSYRHGGHDNSGALIGLGIGLFALGAIVASQHNNDRYDRYQTDYRNDYRGSYQNYRGNGYGYR